MQTNYTPNPRSTTKSPVFDQVPVSSKPELKFQALPKFKSSKTPTPSFPKSRNSRILSPDPQKSVSSFDTKNRNRSYVKLDEKMSRISKVNIRSSRFKSLGFRLDLDRKYKVPNFIVASMVEIFTNTSKEPVALGLLVAKKLVLTSYLAVPNDRFAARCVFRFIADKSYHRARPDKFFYSSIQYNTSAIATSRIRKDTTTVQHPVRLEPIQDLKLGDILFCAETTCFRVQVSNIENEIFGVNSHFTPMTGSPMFTSGWNFAGIANTTSMTYKYTECTVISVIFQVLAFIRSRYNFEISPVKFERNQDIKEPKEIKWFEFSGEYVEVYGVGTNDWKYNRTNWEILWHSAPVHINEEETLLVGGIKKELAVDQVFKYNSVSNEIMPLASMGVARAFCVAVFYDNLVFAIGGKYASAFCEKYLIDEDKWEYIPSMIHERYDHSAVVLNHSIYVMGGEPRRFVGESIEKYDILREMWEEVPTKMPLPVACSPICVLDSYSCGILGGRGSKMAWIMEVSRYHSNDVSFKEGAELAEELESIYPAAYSQSQGKIFILNTAEGFARPILYKVHNSYLPL